MTCPTDWTLIGQTCYLLSVWVAAIGMIGAVTGSLATWIFTGISERKRKREIRMRMSLLAEVALRRTEGVRLRNNGCRISADADEEEWCTQDKKWTEKAILAVAALSPADAERIRTLGKITARLPDNCSPRSPEITKRLRMLTQRTELLDELVLYWGPYVTGASVLPPRE
jgi:hypothetical protein